MRFHRFTGFVESIEGVLRCNRRYRVNGRDWLRWLHQLRAVGLIVFAMPHIPSLASVVSLRDPRHFVSQCGGEGGIRTPVTLTGKPHFECGAFDHSATSPFAKCRTYECL